MCCKECNNEIEDFDKYLAYYSSGKPVYWELCDSCLKKMWLEYMQELKKESE